ncbi:helix-turn-helix domain-containing protein [Terrabacter sp. Root181]|uniref:helix-turn-helix domain-containing protein n=1 Tax=Terrabacter sp. Root181 TaxID=1736484 RepID=UPI0009EB6A0E|nr:helix-turn-helix domain-containing protein [Terrabacter sp. Root181]
MSSTPAQPDPLLDVWQVADYLGYTESAVRRLIRDGILPIIKIGGQPKSRIRIRQSALDALIEASTTPATSGRLA